MSDKTSGVSDNEKKEAEILLFLRSRENASTAEIAEQIRLSLPQTRRILARMAAFGRLVSEGGNRNRRYRLEAPEFPQVVKTKK